MRFSAPVLLCAAVSLSSVSAWASSFYCVDHDTDELLTIDSNTGEIQVVGPLGYDIPEQFNDAYRRVSMTFHNNTLYAMIQRERGEQDLLTIDHSTGAVTSSVDLTYGSEYQGLHVEGLASFGGKLVITCDVPTPPPYTDLIAELSITGEVGTPVSVGEITMHSLWCPVNCGRLMMRTPRSLT